MSMTWQSFGKEALPCIYSHRHKLKTQPNQNIYTCYRNYEVVQKKPQGDTKKTLQRIASKARYQYINFQRENQHSSKQRYLQKCVDKKQKQAAQQKIKELKTVKSNQYYSKTGKTSIQLQSKSKKRVIQQNIWNQNHKQKQTRNNKQSNNKDYQSSLLITQKQQLTFKVDSTEPDEPQKQTSCMNQYYNLEMYNKMKVNKNALQIWKRRKMERQIKQKEGQYRNLIRSLSRKNQKQKSIIKNRMNQVLNDLFLLKKEIKN